MTTPVSTNASYPVLLVLNPNAGKKQGREQLTTVIEPALKSAEVSFRVIETTGRDYAQDYFKDNVQTILAELALHSSGQQPGGSNHYALENDQPSLRIMVLGGDGTVHEIVNGILGGLEEHNLVSENRPNPRISFSIVPLGTGNAIATSLGITTVQEALSSFLKTPVAAVSMRVMTVSTPTESNQSTNEDQNDAAGWKVQTHTLVVNSFGMHCATVYDGDGLRFLGNERFKIAALKNIAFLKQYPATVDLLGSVQKYDRETHALVPAKVAKSAGAQNEGHNNTGSGNNRNEPIVSLPGPFTYLMITKQALLEPGFSPTPFARTSDDWLDVLAVQNAGRGQILDVLGAATKEGYRHIEHEKVEYYKTKVVEIEAPTAGRLCIDGEFMHISPGPKGRIRIGLAADSRQLFEVYGKQ